MAGIQIIGVGGFLGGNLLKYLSSQQHAVFGTSHQKQLTDSPVISFLDLLNPDFGFLPAISTKLQFSILCSSETNIDRCKTESEISKALNVSSMIQLIESLWMNEITPVFISSDAVFDGQTGGYKEADACNPITEYGTQKRCVEEFLIASNKPWLIIRLCKVFDINLKDHTLLTSWLDSLQGGTSIKCASDQYISPTYVLDLCKAVEGLINMGKTGIYHACSPETFSRYDLGLKVAQYFQIDQKKVEKCSIADFSFIEPRSSYNTMNPEKLISELDFQFSTMDTCLEQISSKYEQHEA
jgi:dTDP-4-dehydrorhamnose reductase